MKLLADPPRQVSKRTIANQSDTVHDHNKEEVHAVGPRWEMHNGSLADAKQQLCSANEPCGITFSNSSVQKLSLDGRA